MPSDKDRIRDNQRRSRATKKRYKQELEEKLQKMESKDVEVPKEIHASAKLVAKKNRLLRASLQSEGMTSQEIDIAIGATGGTSKSRVT